MKCALICDKRFMTRRNGTDFKASDLYSAFPKDNHTYTHRHGMIIGLKKDVRPDLYPPRASCNVNYQGDILFGSMPVLHRQIQGAIISLRDRRANVFAVKGRMKKGALL